MLAAARIASTVILAAACAGARVPKVASRRLLIAALAFATTAPSSARQTADHARAASVACELAESVPSLAS